MNLFVKVAKPLKFNSYLCFPKNPFIFAVVDSASQDALDASLITKKRCYFIKYVSICTIALNIFTRKVSFLSLNINFFILFY